MIGKFIFMLIVGFVVGWFTAECVKADDTSDKED